MAIDYGLTYDDGGRIQSTIPGVRRVLPVRIIRENVRFSQNSVPCQILGTLPSYSEIVGIDVLRGRFLSESDELNQDNVCVLTVGLAQRLFPYQDPLTFDASQASWSYRTCAGWPAASSLSIFLLVGLISAARRGKQ